MQKNEMTTGDAFDLVRSSLPTKWRKATMVGPLKEDVEDLYRERITPETDLPPMMPLFSMFDVPCFYRGELVADCGKAKAGKTLFLSILMAACLKGEVLDLKRQEAEALKVLWIDTEQSQQSTQEIMKDRIMPLAGVERLDDDQFYAFNLRGLGSEKRKRLVEAALLSIRPDIAIIDGIKDLMTDINDAVQATALMENLMRLAKETNCCIVCVLHLNKSEQDRNMRGSIGTELTNKAFEVFQCERIEESNIFKVSQSLQRKQKVRQSLCYQIGDDGLPTACCGRGRRTSDRTEPEKLRDIFTAIMEGRRQRPFKEAMAVAIKKMGFADNRAYYEAVREAEAQGIIRVTAHPDTKESWVEICDRSLFDSQEGVPF